MSLLALMAVTAASCGSCRGGGRTGGGAEGEASSARARALLAASAVLPPRAEVVAVADAVSIESSRKGKSADGAVLARLAGDLRARLWRFDQTATDAREAQELYGAAAAATAGTEPSCEADRRRALLAGELARDGAALYREIYLARRRQAPLAAATGGSRCVAALDMALALAVAYRPTDEAMRALEKEGNKVAEAAAKGSAAPSAVSAAPATAAAIASVTGSAGDLVVSPREDAVAKGPVKVVSIEKYGSDKGGRVVVNLSAPASFSVGTLPADDAAGKDARIFVDIARASSKGVPRELEVGGVVRRVRVGVQPAGTRVVLDLTATPFRRIFYLPNPFRIVIDVSTRPPVRPDASGAGEKPEIRRVVIDPGHGGTDAGAVGPTGLREKDVTLDIAHRVAPLLSHELKIETLLTRDSDVFVPLDERTARANAFHADLFISIHCNAAENGQARGVQTFFLDQVRDPEASAMRLAARENTQRGVPPPNPKRLDDEMASILGGLNVGETAARSRHVAELLQRAALASVSQRYPDAKDQGVKTAGFFVLAGADMPAVLFETSFISNTDEEQRLATADYRQKMADAIANAIRAYREGK